MQLSAWGQQEKNKTSRKQWNLFRSDSNVFMIGVTQQVRRCFNLLRCTLPFLVLDNYSHLNRHFIISRIKLISWVSFTFLHKSSFNKVWGNNISPNIPSSRSRLCPGVSVSGSWMTLWHIETPGARECHKEASFYQNIKAVHGSLLSSFHRKHFVIAPN